jgi:hypothetical protein
MNMEATCSIEMSVDFLWTTLRYIPKDRKLHNHRCGTSNPTNVSNIPLAVLVPLLKSLAAISVEVGGLLMTLLQSEISRRNVEIQINRPVYYPPSYGSTALCWTLVTFMLLNPIHSRCDSFDGGLAGRKAATYTQNKTNTE